MTKLSDYIVETLLRQGVRHVFMVSGGGAMHLDDSVGKSDLRYYCNHHEQACAIAAEGYARISGTPGVVIATTGPGGINAINGVFGAWTDSIPMLVISGQVKRETCMASYPSLKIRQLGDQEADIISMVRHITKYAVLVTEPESIRYHLERALHLAVIGRPGPCWLDIPVDVQSTLIEPEKLKGYDLSEDTPRADPSALAPAAEATLAKLKTAQRPVIMPGSGVRLAGALNIFHRLIARLGVPVTPTWTAIDALPNDHPLYAGRPGTLGDRAGNFCVQNADLLLILGSRLSIRQVGYNWPSFAPRAFKIDVDIDTAEFSKPSLKPDLAVNQDLKRYLLELERQLDGQPPISGRFEKWVSWCRERVRRYPPVLPRHRQWNGCINPYLLMEELFNLLGPDDIVACGNASASVIAFQAASIKNGQRLFTNAGCASMGYDLPAAIGAAVAAGGQRVICLAGDGSIQMNIQELQTVIHHHLPVKILVMDNNGYLSIRQTQRSFFGRFVGESPASGVSFPDMVKVASAYGIPACTLSSEGFACELAKLIAAPGPALAVIKIDPQQPFEPKAGSHSLPDGRIVSSPLEDMHPPLDRDELASNMIASSL
jgi:acetolactate synthase-1/2/3 large subunit